MSARPPKPITNNAVLWSDALRGGMGRPTPHAYFETRPCTIPKSRNYEGSQYPKGEEPAEEPCWEFIFKCEESGIERRWGIQTRTGTVLG